jgi:uncharacterized sulfatase
MRRLAFLLLPLLAGAREPRSAPLNFLWVTCEDISPNLRCFGDDYAVTPNLDRLAKEGVRYTRAFAPIGVCAPSRSSLILGAWASSAGTQLMRCKGDLPAYLRCFPESLRGAGYYCTNNVKTDYNFDAPKGTWDESSGKAHWRNRPAGKPFFSVFNITACHESGIRLSEAQYRKRVEGLDPAALHDPAKAPLPPYHPDTPEVRKDWARYADMITVMDAEVGRVLKELADDGLAENTIVFYFSDHGAGMPRSKRWLYDSSLRVPMIVRFPEAARALAPAPPGGSLDRLVTFVDFGPTMISLAGGEIPPSMQGIPFLGPKAGSPREYVHGFRDRMDERTDLLRCVRDRRWKYIRNYRPDLPWAQHIGYMYEMPTMKVWKRLHQEMALDDVKDRFFRPKPAEELYDTEADPWEVRNLAADPEHRATLERLRAELRRWMLEIRDLGFLPEADLRTRFGKTAPHEAVRKDSASYPLERILDRAEGGYDAAALKDPDPAVRYWSVIGARIRGTRDAAPGLEALLQDAAPAVRIAAAETLLRWGAVKEALPILHREAEGSNEWARLQAAQALDDAGVRDAATLELFRRLAKEKGEYVKRVAAHALGE